jgi:peptidyl-dipeptidase A
MRSRIAVLGWLSLAFSACGAPGGAGPSAPESVAKKGAEGAAAQAEAAPATPEQARAFIDDVNKELGALTEDVNRVLWVKATYITDDTEVLATQANDRMLEYVTRKAGEARRFEGLQLPPDVARQLHLLRYAAGLPAPPDPAERAELARLGTEMESAYSKGKVCSPHLKGKGDDPKRDCLALTELEKIMAHSRDPDLLLEIWQGWHAIAPPMREKYQRFVELGNKGATSLGFQDMGDIWRGGYDMSSDAFVQETERLWQEVKPLYEQLHCYVRSRLAKQYPGKVTPTGPIPAHLLGNMWAQEWSNLYPLLAPYPGLGEIDFTPRLVAQKYDAKKMVQLGERFFTSLGMDPLPPTFWQRSLFEKPKDREVECHASAWDVSTHGDLRIKMCIRPNQEDLITIHHELGHDYYFNYYKDKPVLLQAGANDGFHEGIGDTLALSVTPSYLAEVGIIPKAALPNERTDLNLLMQRALDGVAFLPFGKLIDDWRWQVFSGKVPPTEYNQAWWKLRLAYQGIAPAQPRGEEFFDPGAKYHIPANVPYTRYFIARILQYQFHRALCRVAGYEGPLHRCSIYGNKAAGERLTQMLRLGASRPWPEALQVLSGETRMDATAILDYYAPLMTWLEKQNQGQSCGW